MPIFNFMLDYFIKLVAGDRIPSHLEIKRKLADEFGDANVELYVPPPPSPRPPLVIAIHPTQMVAVGLPASCSALGLPARGAPVQPSPPSPALLPTVLHHPTPRSCTAQPLTPHRLPPPATLPFVVFPRYKHHVTDMLERLSKLDESPAHGYSCFDMIFGPFLTFFSPVL